MSHETRLLLDRALTCERAGNWRTAIEICEDAFRQSVRLGDVATLVDATIRLGFSHHELGNRDLVLDYFELALEIAVLHGEFGRAARAYNGCAIHLHKHGELDQAEEQWARARSYALLAGDDLTAGDVEVNLGILANIRGRLDEALSSYEAALRLYRVHNDRDDRIARVLNNLGMLHTDLRQYNEAASALREALAISESTGDLITQSIIYVNQTELFLKLDDLGSAKHSCAKAYEITKARDEDAVLQVQALKLNGVIHTREEDPALAESCFRRAIEVAQASNLPLHEAEVQRELSQAMRAQAREREALQSLNRAHKLFRQLRAENLLADVDERIQQLQDDFLVLVRRWGESIEAKDVYTSGHSERVASYACRIAEAAGMPEEELVWFRMGAFLHDIGKVDVPEHILNKPGRLTDEERRIMEQHTVTGHEMLSMIEFPWDILPMVRSHHERWDGGGYPDGLVGEDIHFSARILRLADIFDALTSARSYRRALSAQEAHAIMEADKSSFDPILFEVFEELFDEFASALEQELSHSA